MDDRAPASELLALIDPGDSFRERLRVDRHALTTLRVGMWTLGRADLPGRLADIETLAHRLAGAAGTFGFVAVGTAAAALEERLIEVRDGRATRANRRRIEAGLDVMAAALADA